MDIEMESNCDNQGNGKINRYLLDKYTEHFKLSQFELHKDPAPENARYGFGQIDNKTNLKGSLKMHKQSQPKHDCLRCGCDYKATQRGYLQIHKQSKHEGLKYGCDQCNYEASGKGQVQKHKESKHEDLKYGCGNCDFTTSRKEYLARHRQVKHECMRCDCDQRIPSKAQTVQT